MNFGVTGVAAPKAASSSTARYSSIARLAAFWRQAVRARDAALAVGVGRNQAGVDGEAFPADQALRHAASHHGLEQLAQQITLAETAVGVLRERRVIRHVAIPAQPAEPAIGQVEVNLLAQPPLRADPEAVADQQHADQQLRIDRGPPNRAVERRQSRPQLLQIYEAVDRPEHVLGRHVPIQRELVEQRRLIDPPLAHHRRISPHWEE
jgi:hypothetical protein